ncbi:MAG: hypothetical protein F6J86_37145 [Symploca sp. SIO1B1]|nr:hypothetical protein [Symploca sp. SIO1C2]NER99385.1 hypothetical protein [Symploca sp. SIO1B1]
MTKRLVTTPPIPRRKRLTAAFYFFTLHVLVKHNEMFSTVGLRYRLHPTYVC